MNEIKTAIEALRQISELTPATCEMTVAHEMGQIAEEALAALTASTDSVQEREALRSFIGAAYPVDTSINPRGYNWCEAYLDEALTKARSLAAKVEQEPVATLHDDGCWTWKGTPPFEANYAGWRMDVYANPIAPQAQQDNMEALKSELLLCGWEPKQESMVSMVRKLRHRLFDLEQQEAGKDAKRLDWLQAEIVDTIYMDDGRIIDVGGKHQGNLRAAIDAAMQASPQAEAQHISTASTYQGNVSKNAENIDISEAQQKWCKVCEEMRVLRGHSCGLCGTMLVDAQQSKASRDEVIALGEVLKQVEEPVNVVDYSVAQQSKGERE